MPYSIEEENQVQRYRQLPQCQSFNGTAFPCILQPTVVFFSIIMALHKVHNKKDVNSSFYLYVPTMTHPEYQIQKKNFSGLSLFYGNNHFFHMSILFDLHLKLQIQVCIYMFIYKYLQKQINRSLGPRVSILKVVYSIMLHKSSSESLSGLHEFQKFIHKWFPFKLNEPSTSFLSKLEEISQNTLCKIQHHY